MEIWLLLHILVITSLIVMMHILGRRMTTDSKKYFIYTLFFVILWVMFDFVVNVAPMNVATMFAVLAHFVISMGAATFFLSCVSFEGNASTRDFAFAFLAIYALFPALFNFQLTTNSFGPYPLYTTMWYVWLIAASLVVIGGLLRLISLREHVNTKPAMRRKLDFFVGGTALVFILPLICIVLVQLIDIPNISALLSLIGLSVAYRTFKK